MLDYTSFIGSQWDASVLDAVPMLQVGAEAQNVGRESIFGVIKYLTHDETCPGGMPFQLPYQVSC